MKIAGIVVLYNPTSKEFKNIERYIKELEYLLIFDNSEKRADGIDQILNDEKVEYYSEYINMGVATALNIGAKKAFEKGYSWLLTMDQDTELNCETIVEMKKYILNHDMSKTAIVTPWHEANLEMEKPMSEVDHPLDVMTSGNLINLSVFQILGGFKEWLFIDGVDIEYCLNVRKNNFDIVRLNYLVIHHGLGDIVYKQFLNRRFMCTNHNYLRNYYMQRNYRYIREMYKEVAPEFCDTLVKIKQIIFKIVLFENDKYRKIRNILRGINDYKQGIKGKYRFKN